MLGDVIGRRRFPGEDIDARHPLCGRIGFDAVVTRDDVQHVQQLTFVFVNTLDLHVEQRLRIQHDIHILRHPLREALLVGELGIGDLFNKRRIVNVRHQLAQLSQIGTPGAANGVIQHL